MDLATTVWAMPTTTKAIRAMHRLTVCFVAVASLLMAAPAHAEEVTDRDRFKLWNNCEAIVLIVEDLNQDASDIGLTVGAIETTIRSRLRAARLYNEDSATPFYVKVHVVNIAFSINVGLNKWLYDDSVSKTRGLATTWSRTTTGTHGGNANYILSNVSILTDIFIDEYLRVNQDAC